MVVSARMEDIGNSRRRSDNQNLRTCAVAILVHKLSGRWVLPTLFLLHHADAPVRFSVILSQLGELLESLNIVHRNAFSEIPPRVEYSCTDLGKSLIPVLNTLGDWVEKNQDKLGPKN
jgi:DNA-binding HxlR family transcriptional regulator